MKQLEQLTAWAAERGVALDAFIDALLAAKATIDPFVVVPSPFSFFDGPTAENLTPTSAQIATCSRVLQTAGFVCLDSVDLLKSAGFDLAPAEAKTVIDDTLALSWDTLSMRYQDLAEEAYPEEALGENAN